MSKFYITYNGKRAGHIWALDEFDARWRFASRHSVDVALVSALEAYYEERYE